ncbi:cell envelope-related function transcriptional attenuator common domain-containing protein [Actinopolymorpha cephalotaxi]|uniref:Cell envelope-related function transcriptional attenuator common domain-containing protein n=1 Tax=Actinopolymorpha cephalotaxi TaxID=504797 RepID=A0A1I2XCZ8_9ACTN|nr:LCP family protein [Actinopolymorpha cephalotaxi]NYH86186.1 LCP family protein required for cell wall assembly [Actinopolymorpha cephalotaxi]SFH11272.1 cell envelope-related function transcriptional attenuator common domain-containing protein [Actinopolymorpha cephalotaxi]
MDGGARADRSSRAPRRRRALRLTALVLAVVLVIIAVVAGFALSRLSGNVSTFDARGLAMHRPPPQKANTAGDTPENVLLLGSDTRAGAGNRTLGGGGAAIGRSDTAILVHVYADHRHAVAVSIPRDTLVDIPHCRLPDGTWSSPQSQTMFNSAFTMGLTVAGNPACTQNTVEKLTGMRVDHTIVVDFEGFAAITKAVGGVRVCVPNNVYAGDLNPNLGRRGKLVLGKGIRTVSGRTALDYVRVRHGIGDGSDIGRIKRQQAFLASLAAKVRATEFDPTKLAPLADAASKALTVDPDLGSATKLLTFALSMRNLGLHDIRFVTVPWQFEGSHVRMVQPDAEQLWSALRADRPLDAGGDNGGTNTGHGITISVFNGTRTSGLAAAAAGRLRADGFKVTRTTNAKSQDHGATLVEYGPGRKADASALAVAVPHARLQPITGSGVDLVLGSDYRPTSTKPTGTRSARLSLPATQTRTAADAACSDLTYGP